MSQLGSRALPDIRPVHYAPLAVDDYFVPGLGRCEVRVISGGVHGDACWNLFWLSCPSIDRMPALGAKWWQHYRPVPGLAAACVRDVGLHPALRSALLGSAAGFARWLSDEDLHDYGVHKVLGVGWRDTMLRRAREAADREAHGLPVIRVGGAGFEIGWTADL